MKRISIRTIPHAEQRYPTAGDYYDDRDTKHIFVSGLGDTRMETLVAIHELIESALCDARGIPETMVMAFDKAHPELDDPGADPRACYHKEHMFADCIERLIARELGVNWDEYNKVLDAL